MCAWVWCLRRLICAVRAVLTLSLLLSAPAACVCQQTPTTTTTASVFPTATVASMAAAVRLTTARKLGKSSAESWARSCSWLFCASSCTAAGAGTGCATTTTTTTTSAKTTLRFTVRRCPCRRRGRTLRLAGSPARTRGSSNRAWRSPCPRLACTVRRKDSLAHTVRRKGSLVRTLCRQGSLVRTVRPKGSLGCTRRTASHRCNRSNSRTPLGSSQCIIERLSKMASVCIVQ